MIHSASIPQLRSEFNDFLFAPVGDDKNGMPISVLSALARLDVDPWQEAAKLARLPGGAATERLTSLIAALPDGPSARRDPATIAARLVTLLPRETGAKMSGQMFFGETINSRAVVRVIFVNVIFIAFMLGAQWFAVSHQMSAKAAADTPATISHAVSAQTPTPNSSRRRSPERSQQETPWTP